MDKYCARCRKDEETVPLYRNNRRPHEWFCARCLAHCLGDGRLTTEEVGQDAA